MTEPSWLVEYTEAAVNFIADHVNSRRVADKLFEYRVLLQEFPDLGKPYDPVYPAARIPFACREIAVPDTPFTIYYMKHEDERKIIIFCIEHQRVDPNARFAGIDYAIVDW